MKRTYQYSEQAAKEYAKQAAKFVVIRTYENGNSHDTRREATEDESFLVESAICAALFAIGFGYDKESAMGTAEYFVTQNFTDEHINTYDSVYIPIGDFLSARHIKAGRAIEGISLNGYEWVLEEKDGDIKWFGSRKEAEAFLLEAGATQDDLYWYRFETEDGREVLESGELLIP